MLTNQNIKPGYKTQLSHLLDDLLVDSRRVPILLELLGPNQMPGALLLLPVDRPVRVHVVGDALSNVVDLNLVHVVYVVDLGPSLGGRRALVWRGNGPRLGARLWVSLGGSRVSVLLAHLIYYSGLLRQFKVAGDLFVWSGDRALT